LSITQIHLEIFGFEINKKRKKLCAPIFVVYTVSSTNIETTKECLPAV
jgi:hypothetical protein